MGLLSRIFGGAPWQTPPIAPQEQTMAGAPQPQPPFVATTLPPMQPIGMPPQPPQQNNPLGAIGRVLGGASGQPQPPAQGVPQPPTIRSNPISFLLGGQNALTGQYNMQLAAEQARLARAAEERNQSLFGMQQTQFGWGQQEQEREAQRRRDWEEAIRNAPPEQQAQLRAVGPDGYAQWMSAQETRRFQAEQAALDRRNAINVAGMRLTGANRPDGASPYWQRPSGRDQIMLQDYEGAVQNGRAALIGLDRLERLFGEMIQRDAQGRPLPASMRMSMSRLMQINPEARAAYEQIQSQVWPLVLQNLEGLAPVTEVELGQALARTVNADMTPEAALAEIRRMRLESERAVDVGLRAYDFVNESGSLTTGRNNAGQNWVEYSGGAYDEARRRAQQDAPPAADARRPGPPPPPPPRPGTIRNGYEYIGGDPSNARSWRRTTRSMNNGNLR